MELGKYLLVHYNDDQRIKGLIAIATPFSGSNLGKPISHRAYQELTPKSSVVLALQKDRSVNHRIVSLYPVFDNHVWAKEGSFLDGAENQELKVHGHHRILASKVLLESVNLAVKKLSVSI